MPCCKGKYLMIKVTTSVPQEVQDGVAKFTTIILIKELSKENMTKLNALQEFPQNELKILFLMN